MNIFTIFFLCWLLLLLLLLSPSNFFYYNIVDDDLFFVVVVFKVFLLQQEKIVLYSPLKKSYVKYYFVAVIWISWEIVSTQKRRRKTKRKTKKSWKNNKKEIYKKWFKYCSGIKIWNITDTIIEVLKEVVNAGVVFCVNWKRCLFCHKCEKNFVWSVFFLLRKHLIRTSTAFSYTRWE